MKTQNFDIFQLSLKLNFDLCQRAEISDHLSFVNISPTLVIDISMERSSRVLQHGNPKFFSKCLELNFELYNF